jgi:transcriptional regulator with XRE-family HTH domain
MLATDEGSTAKTTLGRYLASIRKDRNLTLREVEEKTKRQVSHAYLSQIETGAIKQPSPNAVHALAEAHEINFESLMERAGFVATSQRPDERRGRVTAFAEHNLTPEEEQELMEYLQFMRNRKRPDHKSELQHRPGTVKESTGSSALTELCP